MSALFRFAAPGALGALLLLASTLPAQPALEAAWLKDADGDGAGDRVYFRFSQPLETLPDSAEAQWNGDTSAFRGMSAARLAFAGGGTTVVVADFSASPFPKGRTGVVSGQPPRAKISTEKGSPWLARPLQDSIPPILLDAMFRAGTPHPGSTTAYDTLRVQVSEPLWAATDFIEMFRYSPDCADTGRGRVVTLASNPFLVGGNYQYLAIVEHASSSPRAGGCLALNGSRGVSDLSGNVASEGRIPLRGPGVSVLRRPLVPGSARLTGARHAVDGRRLPPIRGGSALRVANLITFMVASPQEGIPR